MKRYEWLKQALRDACLDHAAYLARNTPLAVDQETEPVDITFLNPQDPAAQCSYRMIFQRKQWGVEVSSDGPQSVGGNAATFLFMFKTSEIERKGGEGTDGSAPDAGAGDG